MNENAIFDFIHDVNSLNPIIHSQTRFIILNILNNIESCNANFLTETMKITWGNFSTHIAKLEAAQYIVMNKTYENKKPITVIQITQIGKYELEEYIKKFDKIIKLISS